MTLTIYFMKVSSHIYLFAGVDCGIYANRTKARTITVTVNGLVALNYTKNKDLPLEQTQTIFDHISLNQNWNKSNICVPKQNWQNPMLALKHVMEYYHEALPYSHIVGLQQCSGCHLQSPSSLAPPLCTATPPLHLSPQPSPPSPLPQVGSGRGDKPGRGKPSAISTQQTQPSPPKTNTANSSPDNSIATSSTKSPLVTPPPSQGTPATQGGGPVRKRLPSQPSPACSQPSSMVVTTTIAVTTRQALTAISTATSSVRSLSQVVCQGAKPPVSRLAATPPPATTSVTMTTKKPISSSTVKTRLVDVKLARKMAASRQPESRVKSTASKGISYSAVVGGTRVKEDNPAFNVVSAH